MKNKLLLLLFIFIGQLSLFAQNDSLLPKKEKKNIVSFEYLGRIYFARYSAYYTVNYTRQLYQSKRYSIAARIGGTFNWAKYYNVRTNTFINLLIENKIKFWKSLAADISLGYVHYNANPSNHRFDDHIGAIHTGLRYDFRYCVLKLFYHYSEVIRPSQIFSVDAWNSNKYFGIGFSVGFKF